MSKTEVRPGREQDETDQRADIPDENETPPPISSKGLDFLDFLSRKIKTLSPTYEPSALGTCPVCHQEIGPNHPFAITSRARSQPSTNHTPGETLRYRLTQKLDAAVRQLRDAEDIARTEFPPEWPAADRIRSIYEQITADLLEGKQTLAPIARRLRNSQERCLRLANALDDMGMPEKQINDLWGVDD